MDLIGDRPVQPWGDEPPPAPPTATRAEHRNVSRAFTSWRHYRPWYTRDGDVVEAVVDLHDNVWRGTGTGPTEADAAWAALQSCIDSWRASVQVDLGSLVKRLLGRPRPSRQGD